MWVAKFRARRILALTKMIARTSKQYRGVSHRSIRLSNMPPTSTDGASAWQKAVCRQARRAQELFERFPPRDSREDTEMEREHRVVSGAGGWIGAAVASPAAKVDRSGGGIAYAIAMTRKPKWRRRRANCRLAHRASSSDYFEKLALPSVKKVHQAYRIFRRHFILFFFIGNRFCTFPLRVCADHHFTTQELLESSECCIDRFER